MPPPNILLINCDDLGYGDLGCYGSSVNSTPAIDGLAAEGVRFTDFCMASPVCSPSRAAMLTGCYPPRTGMTRVLFPGEATGLGPGEITIARMLKSAGYATRLVGKWHCGDQPEFLPTRHGSDGYFGLPYSNDMGVCPKHPGGRSTHPPLPLLRDEEVIQAQPEQASLTERYVDDCVRFIRENKDAPFFLYLAHMHVHLPHCVAPRFLKGSRNGPYGAAVECIDWSVAALRYELERLGLLDETLILFTSDNGSRGDRGGSNYTLREAKGSTWEGGMRVPLIARWPKHIPAGGVCRSMASAMDFLPTIANLTGTQVPSDRNIDGRDIGALLEDPAAPSPHEAFFYFRDESLKAVRSGDWKLHSFLRGDGARVEQLYNLSTDPSEQHDVLGENTAVAERLRGLMEAAREDLGDAAEGRTGMNCRPVGRVAEPKTLTRYDPNCPYMWAEYDLVDVG